jgi:hypothetical protein
MSDVNYSCRSTTTISAGPSHVLPLVSPPPSPPPPSGSCRHLRRSCRRSSPPPRSARSLVEHPCSSRSCRHLRRRSCRSTLAHANETLLLCTVATPCPGAPPSPAASFLAPTPTRPCCSVRWRRRARARPLCRRSFRAHANEASLLYTVVTPRPNVPRAPPPSQRTEAASLIRCPAPFSSSPRCASSPPPPARCPGRSR